MKYSLELSISLPRDRVVSLFDNAENLKKWQPTLLSVDHLSGEPGKEGAMTNLTYDFRGKEMVMLETIVVSDFPDRFSATYEAGKVWNRVDNIFVETEDGKTLWKFESEFKCGGFMKVIAILMPGSFRKESMKSMEQFKEFAEAST